ncbi:MAG: leucine-rich repeat protein [Lachnospiraceae bacterium]|nr:leucine-rich repeat protein [Bacillota bacterium]MDY3769445.1 leucine-rich repeat protein [Lachnospiraceae bacterium]
MKRKLCQWLLSCALFTVVLTGSPKWVNASCMTTRQVETMSANTVVSLRTDEKEEEGIMQEEDLFEKDPMALSEAELTNCLNSYQDGDIAVWLSCLPKEAQENLLARSEKLSETLDYYGMDLCRECGLVDGAHFETNLQYYQTLAGCQNVGAVSFSGKSGFYYIDFTGPQAGRATVKISNIDATRQLSQRQTGMSTTVSGSRYGLKVIGKGNYTYQIESTKEQALSDVAKLKSGGKISYPHSLIQFSFVKPVGYAFFIGESTDRESGSRGSTYPLDSAVMVDETYKGVRYLNNNALSGDSDYGSEKTVAFEQYVHLPTNAGVGATSIDNPAKIHNMVFHFNIVPASYRVVFDGNGGSSIPAAIDCEYGKQAVYPAGPGKAPSYLITVNSNGAEGTVAPIEAVRNFLNWGDAGAVPGALFSNLTFTNGAVITKSANWSSSGSYVLPAQLHREYTVTYNTDGGNCEQAMSVTNAAFLGWYADPGMQTKIGDALSQTETTGNGTIYAGWGTGEAVLLPNAQKEGSHLLGWAEENNSDRLYQPGESYHPDQNHTLYAKWEADLYTICLDPMGGSLETEETDFVKRENSYAKDVVYGESVQLPNPVRTGYLFKGWRTKDGFLLTGSIKNLTAGEDGMAVLQAEYQPLSVNYTVKYYLQPDEQEADPANYTEYMAQAEGQGNKALADTQVRIFPITINGYEKPDSQLVTIKADGSTVVKFYYRKNATKAGRIPEEQENMDNGLSVDLQKKILEALEQGSSAGYTINEVTYTLRKNDDGTLTILLNGSAGLEKLIIPDVIQIAGKTLTITEIAEKAFYGQSELKEVVMGSGITKIGDSAFENCNNLEKISIGDHVTVIGSKAFKNCTALKTASIPKAVLRIGDSAFEGCGKLKKLTLRNGLLQIGNKAFYRCTILKSVKVPKSVLEIGAYAFAGCSRLGKFTFAQNASLLRIGTGMLQNAISLKKIKLPDKLQTISDLVFQNAGKLESCQLGSGTVKIGQGAFQSCKKLQKLVLPEQVQTIGKRAFHQCKKLKKITIRTTHLRKIGKDAFKGCASKIRFAVPKEKKTAYAKLLKGKYEK